MAVEHRRRTAELINREIARFTKPLFLNGGRTCLYGSAAEAIARSEEAVRSCHIDKAAAAREILDPADCRVVALILLLLRDGIMPDRAVRELKLHIVSNIEPCPARPFATHLHFHGTVGESLPVGAVLHEEVDRTELSRRHTVAARIGIVADPVRVCCGETDGDATFRAHAAVCDDITFDDSAICIGTVGKTVCSLRNVEIDCAVVVRSKLAVSADRCPGAASGADDAAADVNARGDSTDAFICPFTVWICAVCKDIDKTVNRDV